MTDGADLISPLQMRLAIYRRTIDFLEAQRAQLGPFVPSYILHQLDETRREIASLKQELQALGIVVEERAGDSIAAQTHNSATSPLFDTTSLLLTYRRMLADQVRFIPLTGMSGWGDLTLQIADVYVEQTLVALGPGPHTRHPVHEVICSPGVRMLVEARLGSGKSILLRHLVLESVLPLIGEARANHPPAINWPDTAPLPILISARDCVAALNRSDNQAAPHHLPALASFWTIVEEQLQRNDLGQLASTIQQHLESGACLVMIDGLDDLADAQGGRTVAAIIGRFVARYPGNRYVVTCRNRATASVTALTGFSHYALAPLDEKQTDHMIARWYTAIAASVGVPARVDLPERIVVLQGHMRADERLAPLAENPLTLALCVLVDAEGHRLPQARSMLYQRWLDLLLDRWENLRSDGTAPTLAQALGIPALAMPNQRQALLRALAIEFQNRPDFSGDQPASMRYTEIEPLLREPLALFGIDTHRAVEKVIPQLIDWCCRHEILQQTDPTPAYAMPQRWLREYLAASFIAQLPDFPTRAYSLSAEPRWRHTVLLAVQELRQGLAPYAARELPRLLIEAGGAQNLLLAAECLLELGDASGPTQTLCDEAQRRLIGLLANPIRPVAERVRAGLLLGRLGDPRFTTLRPPVVWVAGGPFLLGARDGYDDEGPVQVVDVPAFAIGAYPVTNNEYARFLADEPDHPRPRYWHDPRFNNPSQPVVGVTWNDATAYCTWLTGQLVSAGLLPNDMVVRLPHELEWEKAASWDAKHALKRRYPWGDDWSSARANTVEGRGAWTTTPAGCYPAGVSAYGAHDLIGNVWEWTASTYASYPGAMAPFDETESYVLRGSSCASLPIHARCTYRSRLPAHYWRYHLGFRIAIALPLEDLV